MFKTYKIYNIMLKIVFLLLLSFFFSMQAKSEEILLTDKVKEIPAHSSILICDSRIIFENIVNEMIYEFPDASQLNSLFVAEAKNAIASSNAQINIIDKTSAINTVYQPHCQELSGLAKKLALGQLDDYAYQILKKLSAPNKNIYVLSHELYAKTGPGGSWDPYSGAISSTSSVARYRISLIDCQTGEVIWKNEKYIRKIPDYKSTKFIGFIRMALEGTKKH